MIADRIKQAASTPALAGVFVKSIRIASTYAGDAIMTIAWSWPEHGAVEQPSGLSGVAMTVSARPSDATIAIALTGPTVREAERAMIDAAWALGAWDVRRIEHAPLAAPDKWRESRHGISSDFGALDLAISGHAIQSGDCLPDSAIQNAASDGWVSWSFVPLSLASHLMRKRWGGKDKTLADDCTRLLPSPSMRLADWYQPEPGHAHEHIYQLGRANHGNRSKASTERRA